MTDKQTDREREKVERLEKQTNAKSITMSWPVRPGGGEVPNDR